MKSLLVLLALIGAALAMPVAEKEASDQSPTPLATPEIKAGEPLQAEAITASADKPAISSETILEEKKPEIKSEPEASVKPQEKPAAQSLPEIKSESSDKIESNLVPELKNAVPEKSDAVPQIDAAKTNVVSNVPTAQPEIKSSPLEEVKTPAAEAKSEIADDTPSSQVKSDVPIKSESGPTILSKPVAEVKREAIPEVKSEEPAKEKSEDVAKVVEVTKEEVKTSPPQTVDVIKAANEMAGVADEAVDSTAFITKPEKKIDIPAVVGKSETPIVKEESKKDSEEKKISTSNIDEVKDEKLSAKSDATSVLEPKPAEPSTKIETPTIPDSKSVESEDSLRVVRDTVDDQLKADEEKTAEKPAPKSDAKSEESTKTDAEKVPTLSTKESPKADEPAKADDSVKPAESSKPLESAAPAVPVDTAKLVEASNPVEVAKTAEPAKPEELAKSAESPKPTEAAKSEDSEESSESTKAEKVPKATETPKTSEPAKPIDAPEKTESEKKQEPTKVEEPSMKPEEPSSEESGEENSSEEEKPAAKKNN